MKPWIGDVDRLRVRRGDQGRAVEDGQVPRRVARGPVGDDQRPAGVVIQARVGLDVRHGVRPVAGLLDLTGDVSELTVVVEQGRGVDNHADQAPLDRLVARGTGRVEEHVVPRRIGRIGAPVEAGEEDGGTGGQIERGRARIERGRILVHVDVAHVVVVVVQAARPDAGLDPGRVGIAVRERHQRVADDRDVARVVDFESRLEGRDDGQQRPDFHRLHQGPEPSPGHGMAKARPAQLFGSHGVCPERSRRGPQGGQASRPGRQTTNLSVARLVDISSTRRLP